MHFDSRVILSIVSRKSLVDDSEPLGVIGIVLATLFNQNIPLGLVPFAAGLAREQILKERPDLRKFSEPGDIRDTVDSWLANALATVGESIELELMPDALKNAVKEAVEAFPREHIKFHATRHGIKKQVGLGG